MRESARAPYELRAAAFGSIGPMRQASMRNGAANGRWRDGPWQKLRREAPLLPMTWPARAPPRRRKLRAAHPGQGSGTCGGCSVSGIGISVRSSIFALNGRVFPSRASQWPGPTILHAPSNTELRIAALRVFYRRLALRSIPHEGGDLGRSNCGLLPCVHGSANLSNFCAYCERVSLFGAGRHPCWSAFPRKSKSTNIGSA